MNKVELRGLFDSLITMALFGVVLILVFLTPFPEPFSKVLASGIAIATMVWAFTIHLRTNDEVASETWKFSASAGAAVGLPVAMALAVVVRSTPSLAELLGDMVATSSNPAVVGFVLGTTVTICLFAITASITVIARVNRMRRQ